MGSIPNKENRSEYLFDAIDEGFMVEVDIMTSIDGELYLGHDSLVERLTDELMCELLSTDCAIFHVKDLGAIHKIQKYRDAIHWFWHDKDNITLTSRNLIWTWPGTNFSWNTSGVIENQPEFYDGQEGLIEWIHHIHKGVILKPHGVCSDYVWLIRQSIERKL